MWLRLAFALWLAIYSSRAGAREVSITILHTTDLHGRFDNPLPERPGDLPEAGLLRVATLIHTVRQETPHVLLVDCGDTIQGTPDSSADRGRGFVAAMERLRYDAWVPGNHEFDYGFAVFRELHDQTAIPILAANLTGPPGDPDPLPRRRSYRICEVEGVRVALIGLTTPGTPHWLPPEKLGPLRFTPSIEALQKTLHQVRAEQADLLVLLAHQGLRPEDDFANEIRAIARTFPELHLILGGHTHQVVAGQEINGVLYAQAGYHGHFLGRVDFIFDTATRSVVRRESRLLPVTPDVPEDPELAKVFSPLREQRNTALEQIVGEAMTPFTAKGAPHGLTATAALLRAAIAEAAGADIVLHGQLTNAELEIGPVRERHVWRLVPYEDHIVVAWLTFDELREILEEAAAYWNTPSFLGSRGVHYVLRPEAPSGSRIGPMTLPDGTTPPPSRRFKVAFNSYTAASAGLRHAVLRRVIRQPEARPELTPIELREALRAYIRKHSPLTAPADSAEGVRAEHRENPPSATTAEPSKTSPAGPQ